MRPHPVSTATIAAIILLCSGTSSAQAPTDTGRQRASKPTHREVDREFLAREWERFVSSGAAEQQIARALDVQMRQNLAAELAELGERVDWREHSWQELRDMQLRAAQARVLRDRFGLRLRWRSYPLVQLRDFEARIQKAEQLEQQGVKVDWRSYTYEQLDEWVRYRMRVRAMVQGLPFPGNITERDPDEVLEPSFIAARPSQFEDDPDAVLEPTFTERRPTRRVR